MRYSMYIEECGITNCIYYSNRRGKQVTYDERTAAKLNTRYNIVRIPNVRMGDICISPSLSGALLTSFFSS